MQIALTILAAHTAAGAVIGLSLWAKAPAGPINYRRLLAAALLWPALIRGRVL